MSFIAIATAGSALIGGAVTSAGQANANTFNKQEADVNRGFQERMASTQYQRGVADMRAAGINPMLAYMNGGASSAGGAQAQAQSEAPQGLGNIVPNVQSAIASREELKNQREARYNTEQDTQLKMEQQGIARENAKVAAEEAKQAKMTTELQRAGLSSGKAMAPAMPFLKGAESAVSTIGQGAALRNSAKALDMRKQGLDLRGLRGVRVK